MGKGEQGFQMFDSGTLIGAKDNVNEGLFATDSTNFYLTAALALITTVASIVGLSSGYALIDPQLLVYISMGCFAVYGIQFLFVPKMFCDLHFRMRFDAYHAFTSRLMGISILAYCAAVLLLEPLTALRLNTAVVLAVTWAGPYYAQAFLSAKPLHWSAPVIMSMQLVFHAYSFAGNPSVHTFGIETYSQGYLLFSFIGVMGYCLQVLFFPALFWKMMGLEEKSVDRLTEWLLACCFAGWGVGKLACALAGYEETVLFCYINLVPMALMSLWGVRNGVNKLMFFPPQLMFIAGYTAVIVCSQGLGAPLTVPIYSFGQGFLIFSACGASMFGIAYAFFPAQLAAFSGLKRQEFDPAAYGCIAVSCLGWGAGKLACALAGRNATLFFCWINLVPMFACLGYDVAEGAPAHGVFPRLFFLVMYIFIVAQDLLHQS